MATARKLLYVLAVLACVAATLDQCPRSCLATNTHESKSESSHGSPVPIESDYEEDDYHEEDEFDVGQDGYDEYMGPTSDSYGEHGKQSYSPLPYQYSPPQYSAPQYQAPHYQPPQQSYAPPPAYGPAPTHAPAPAYSPPPVYESTVYPSNYTGVPMSSVVESASYMQPPIALNNYSVPSYAMPVPPPTYIPVAPPSSNYSSQYQQPASQYQAPTSYEQPSYQPMQVETYQPSYAPAPSYQPPMAPAYQAPVQPQYPQPSSNYSQPQYEAPHMVDYGSNYSHPSYQQPQYQPVSNYSQPSYQQPAMQYQPVSNYSQPSYQPPAQQPSYSAPSPQPAYSTPAAPAYQQPQPQPQPAVYPAPSNYSQPAYGQPPAANYSQPSYQAPVESYKPAAPPTSYPAPPAKPAYSTPPAPAMPSYQQPAPYQPTSSNYTSQQQSYGKPASSYGGHTQQHSNYSEPSYNTVVHYPTQMLSTATPYSVPASPPHSMPMAPPMKSAPYSKPVPNGPAKVLPFRRHKHGNYAVANYTHHPQSYHHHTTNQYRSAAQFLPPSWWIYQAPIGAAHQSSYALTPLTMPYQGPYVANHWTLAYYQPSAQRPYRQCPGVNYSAPGGKQMQPPTYTDYQAAFAYAQQRVGQMHGTPVAAYPNNGTSSADARHMVFSNMAAAGPHGPMGSASSEAARLDAQGLLVEYASHYIADRLCLTKWERQRYLPTLTMGATSSSYPSTSSCSSMYSAGSGTNWGPNKGQWTSKYCAQSRYRTYDGFCNNLQHPYWGKSNVCHIRLLSPDYADGVSEPRVSHSPAAPLPNPRAISNYIHLDIPLEGPYNLMKMQWGQFINHDITNTALSAYDGLVDCCRQPSAFGCAPIYVPKNDPFYGSYNVTCMNFIRSGSCPLCQFGPRQQLNRNSAFLDLSTVYGSDTQTAASLRSGVNGQLRVTMSRNGEPVLPLSSRSPSQEQCGGTSCYAAGDSRSNQHPALTALHVILLRRHNQHAQALKHVHPNYNDEQLFQEARRILIAEYQMITYAEYLPIVFGPILSQYYKLTPLQNGYTHYDWQVDPSTWNEYVTAACRFGHSQISNTFGLYSRIMSSYESRHSKEPTYRLNEWFLRPSFIADGLTTPMIKGMLSRSSMAIDPWVAGDVRNYLYRARHERHGGDLAAINIQRGRDHGLPGYTQYLQYCFNYKVRSWKDLALYIPWDVLEQLKHLYGAPENIDLFTGGLSERHFPEADIGPTFACINGIQYYHLKHGDRYYFEHGGQAGSFQPAQLQELRKSTLSRLLCRTAYLDSAPAYSFFYPSQYNALLNCSSFGELNYALF